MTIVFLQEGQVALLKVHQVLQKKEEGSKSINETLLSRLRPYRSSSTAASLVALSGTETTPARKDDNNGEKMITFILDDQTQVDSKPTGQPEHASLNQCQLIAAN